MSKRQHKIQQKAQRPVARKPKQRDGQTGTSLSEYLKGKEIHLLLILIFVVVIFVFKDFLFLKNTYLFKDIGSDSINWWYPNTVHLVDYLRTEGIPKWSFNQGMGQTILGVVNFDPFLLVFYLLGRDNVAYGIVYVEVLKIILAGIFFYLYLRVLELSTYSALVGGLLYGFTGYMILGGGWYIFSYDALCISLLLYSFEKLFKENVWYLLPIPIALMGSYQPFHLYLYAVLLFVYGLVRYVDEKEWNLKGLAVFYVKVASIYLLGIALSSIFFFANVLQLLQGPRAGGEASYFQKLSSQPIFGLAPAVQYISVVLRSYSSDLLGTGNFFKGWGNYLESPLTYCGLLSLLLAPQFFVFQDRRRRIIFSVALVLCMIPLLFPFFRYVFWGFTGDYFRVLSFFITLGLLYLSLRSLSNIDNRNALDINILVASLIVALGILYIPFDQKNQIIDQSVRIAATIFLVIYAILLVVMRLRTYKAYAQVFLLVVLCMELAYFSSITVNKRDVLTSIELHQKMGYNDYTNEAVAFIDSIDRGFFRVNKDYFSGPAMHGSLNDAKIQRYRGTTSYHSFNQKYYIEFLQAVGVVRVGNEHDSRWAIGLTNRPLLQIMGSVKYSLTKRQDDYLLGRGYDYLNTFGNVRAYRSRYALPLGFTYDTYITESDFSTLSPLQKDVALLRGFVIRNEQRTKFEGFRPVNIADTGKGYTFGDLGRDVQTLRQDTLMISEHGQNVIKGTIHLDKQKMLFFSIPYDKGWSARVDGKKAPLELVNIGFTGLLLDKGTHSVELEYQPPYLAAGAVVSVISLLIYGVLVFLSLRSRKKSVLEPSSTAQRLEVSASSCNKR